MLTSRLRRILLATLVVAGLAAGSALQGKNAWADDLGPTPSSAPGEPIVEPATSGVGLAVSWTPTTSPVKATPGATTSSTIWVTNQGATAIPITVLPVTAVPGDNGSLTVQSGADQRFPAITYSPNRFVAQPGKTTAISVTVTFPDELGAGVYMIPALIRPDPPKTDGNIKTLQEIIALTTFQVPGVVDAHLVASFLDPTNTSGMLVSQLPGLPQIQIGARGQKILRVLNDSQSSLYSYNEVIATQAPAGHVTFRGHTEGAPGNLRTEPALYFAEVHRDYPMSWTPSPFGLGLAHLTAYVSYHADPAVLEQVSASTAVLVISPWWFFAVVISLLTLLLSLRATTRDRSHPVKGRRRQQPVRRTRPRSIGRRIATSALLAAVVLVTAVFSASALFIPLGLVGVLVAGTGVVVLNRRGGVAAANGLRIYLATTALLLTGGAMMLLLAALSIWPLGPALAVLAGAGVWTLSASGARWWNVERSSAPAPLDDELVPAETGTTDGE